MTVHWRHMISSSPISPCRGPAARAKRGVAALLALLLCVPATLCAAAVSLPATRNVQDMAEALDLFLRGNPTRKEGVRVGDWYLHPQGFAFVIPEGFTSQKPSRGTTVLLVEDSNPGLPFRTTINIAVTERDSRMRDLTPESVKSKYGASFSRFTLLCFTRETMYGSEGVRLLFFSGNTPKLLFEQCLFEMGGHSYVITLISENHVRSLPRALQRFEALCDTLLFAKQAEGSAAK